MFGRLRKALSKKRILIGILLVVIISGALVYWFFLREKADSNVTTAPPEFISALTTSQEAVKNGITNETAEEALFIATDLINKRDTKAARDYVNGIDDAILSNNQLTNKYVILLDSYRMEGDKNGYSQAAEKYKVAVAARGDATLAESIKYLTPDFIERVFTPQPEVPGDEEIP